jgi:hypothetical protein
MPEYSNENRGAIWKNDKKETERHPDFTGSLNVEGVDYWVSAWKRGPDANPRAPALSFSVKRKEPKAETHQSGMDSTYSQLDAAPQAEPNDPIPF